MSQQPAIACDLTAINDLESEQHRTNAEAIFDAISEIRETPEGYKFKLPANTNHIEKAGAFIARERLCCPFFEFTLTIQPEQKPVWLRLTGRDGVKSYIKETLLPKLDAPIVN